MEPARSTDEFSRRITAADANNIVTVLDLATINAEYQAFEQDYIVKFQTALEDVKCTVGLFSLAEASFPDTNALASEAQQNAEIAKVRTEGQKIAFGLYTAKGNGPWIYKARVVLQNQGGDENHVPILVPFLSTNETFLVGGNFKLGVKIEPIWNQPLKAQDYIVVTGTYKQVVSFSSKKKDNLDNLEDLKADMETLKLAIYGRLVDLPPNSLLGRNDNTGTVESISQTKFATPTQTQTLIDQAILAIIEGAPGILSTLDNLASAINDDANFGVNVTNLIATKAPLANPIFTGIINNSEGRIQFPSIQVSSTDPNCLDDYEEGTFTPTVIGMTTPGTATYTSQIGNYTKIGKRIFFDIFVEWTAHTGSGEIRITGLPFLFASSPISACSVWHRNYSLSTNNILMAYVGGFPGAQGHIVFHQVSVGGGASSVVPLDSAAGLMINGSYSAVN